MSAPLRVAGTLEAMDADPLIGRRREQADLTLSASEESFRLLVESVQDYAILMLSPEGNIATWNTGAERIKGYRSDEIIGQHFSVFYPPEDVASGKPERELAAAEAEGRMEDEGWRVKHDGTRFWANVVITALRDKQGKLRGFGKVTRDLTERRAHEQAQEASRLKSEFVANMSHELRTPLNGVIGMTQLLRDTALDERQSGYVDALGASSDALLAVISNVLDFSKMQAGRLELDRTDFDIRDVVEEATLMLAEQAHVKGLEIGHWVEDEVPIAVNGDRARLLQILLNLLSNAVKFTAVGEVALRVESSVGDELRFSVLDTGIGIDEEQAAMLFDAFAQADLSTTRQYGGTGLGLAISRRLVELMEGRIGAEHREDEGSVFWFSAAMPAVAGVGPAARARTDLQARRILIVDDNATNRTILEQYLRGWGVACESVDQPNTALDALERAARHGQPFELAVLDFTLLKTDGPQLVRDIRMRPSLGALRVVILHSAPIDDHGLDGLGVSATLTQPAGQAAIYDAIADALAGRAPRVAPAQPTKASPVEGGQVVLVAEDNEINYAVAAALLNGLGLKAVPARHGGQAIDMAAAHDYAAIFMDCQMPVADGFEATRQIRAAESTHRVPIIAMTALSMPGDRERCLQAGMDDYVSKPILREELEGIVERLLPSRRTRTPAP
jgi:two-component system sensor histidine kinase/response regulator